MPSVENQILDLATNMSTAEVEVRRTIMEHYPLIRTDPTHTSMMVFCTHCEACGRTDSEIDHADD